MINISNCLIRYIHSLIYKHSYDAHSTLFYLFQQSWIFSKISLLFRDCYGDNGYIFWKHSKLDKLPFRQKNHNFLRRGWPASQLHRSYLALAVYPCVGIPITGFASVTLTQLTTVFRSHTFITVNLTILCSGVKETLGGP